MLSIIISSYQPNFYKALVDNIAVTIGEGVHFEIIPIWNPNLMSITKAYNTGAEKAKYENLLFLHEDVLFHTQNWGEKLIKHLDDPETGIIGIAGSDYVPAAPSGWYITGHSYVYLVQNNKNHGQTELLDSTTQIKHKVFALDGVFLAMKKAKSQEFPFNEEITGFHAYDLDISLRFSKKYKNYVISDILIEHFSKGDAGKDWFCGSIIVRKKYGSAFQSVHNGEIERDCFEGFLFSYFKYFGINRRNALSTVRFIPRSRIAFSEYIALLKTYYRYFKYKNYHQEKFAKD